MHIFTKKFFAVLPALIVVATVIYSLSALMPGIKNSEPARLTEFSLQKALHNLKEISKHPHYAGSAEHKKVQDYIVEQLQLAGLETEIQNQLAINKKIRNSANVQNILARIKGSAGAGKKALLLLTHYDSSPHSSPGASDAGSGVVTILEAIRAFMANNTLPENDIIILISDAEEIGLLGANAFVNHHRWASDVGLVLNFEARGTSGPSYMLMETNGGNKNLVQQFSQAEPGFPVANSLMYSIYKMLPNDTDLTVFREDGDIEGYNFAFIDNHFDYHTAQDSYQRLDIRSLKHQAEYLVPLLKYFSSADLTNLKSDRDYVYFSLPGTGMFSFPYTWVLPFLILVIFLFVSLTAYGIAHRKISPGAVAQGFIPLFLSLTITGLTAYYGWALLLKLYPQYSDIQQGFTYNGHLYIAAFSALSLAITFLIYSLYFRSIKAAELTVAPVFIWILINIAVTVYLKGAGFFIIAALTGLSSLAILLLSDKHPQKYILLISILSIPAMLIFSPMVQMFPVGLGLKALTASTTIIVLLFGLLIPVFSFYKKPELFGYIFFVLSIVIFFSAALKSDYSENRKQPNSIIYMLDTDKNAAWWLSHNTNVDTFTRQFFGEKPETDKIETISLSNKYNSRIKLQKKTTARNLVQSIIKIISDTTTNNDRKIHITITPQRKVNTLELTSEDVLHLKQLTVNGESVSLGQSDGKPEPGNIPYTLLRHYITEKNEVLDVELLLSGSENINLTLFETSYDLLENPLFSIKPRDSTMMPTPYITNDAIVLKKRIPLSPDY